MEEGTAPEKLILASVMIDVEGDFANRAELKVRDAVEAKLNSLGIGHCVGSGSGMGMMDIDFLLNEPDAEAARPIIEQAMAEAFPANSSRWPSPKPKATETSSCPRSPGAGVRQRPRSWGLHSSWGACLPLAPSPRKTARLPA